jgi:hypothetical protein
MRIVILIVALVALPFAASAQTTCASPTYDATSVGTAATSVPASALAGRAGVAVCNSASNTGTAVVKCREDGIDPSMVVTTGGDVLTKGACIPYAAPSGKAVRCIADAAATVVTSRQCKAVVPAVPSK